MAPSDQHDHDRPGDDDAFGDRRRTEMEKRRRWRAARSWRGPLATVRMTTERAISTPSAVTSSGSAPSKLASASTTARRPKRPIVRATAVAMRPPRGEQARVPPERAEISDAERHPYGEMRCEAERHRPRRQAFERPETHALFIHFQADQHPSAKPSISSGAVQNRPELNVLSSQRPAKTPISIGVTMIQPSTPIWARRRATEGSPSRSQRRRRFVAQPDALHQRIIFARLGRRRAHAKFSRRPRPSG